MMQNDAAQADQAAAIGEAAAIGAAHDTMDVDADVADPAAADPAAVAAGADDPPPPPPPADPAAANAHVPPEPYCSACHVPLINRTTGVGQLYKVMPNTHNLLSTRQLIYTINRPALIRYPVPVCYCCLSEMILKAYIDLHAAHNPGAIEITDDMFGMNRG